MVSSVAPVGTAGAVANGGTSVDAVVSSHGIPFWALPFAALWRSIMGLGEIWDTARCQKDMDSGRLLSKDAGSPLRIGFCNATPLPLVLCWIDEHGELQHFRSLEPHGSESKGDILSAPWDLLERTYVGHAFVVGTCNDVEEARKNKKLDRVLGGYRPKKLGKKDVASDAFLHVVTFCPSAKGSGGGGGICSPKKEQTVKVSPETLKLDVLVDLQDIDPTPLDTSNKRYDSSQLGEWPVRLENNWNKGDKKLKKLLIRHLREAAKHLPEHARETLRTNTPIYINRSLQYGPAMCPVNGRGLCFHPEPEWLEENGMCKDKCGCVEMYKAADYTEDCDHWGPGGVLLHEFCHAYHHKMVKDGYNNKDIQKCYEAAMKEGLYDKVRVHGSQGPTAKAYACNNAMEYFAELSVAFLAGLDDSVEYNKWEPFNRSELKKFDPRAYQMLQKIWKVDAP